MHDADAQLHPQARDGQYYCVPVLRASAATGRLVPRARRLNWGSMGARRGGEAEEFEEGVAEARAVVPASTRLHVSGLKL